MLSEELLGSLKVFGSIDANGLDISKSYTDAIPILEPTELFQTLGLLETALRQLGNLAKHFTTVGIDA